MQKYYRINSLLKLGCSPRLPSRGGAASVLPSGLHRSFSALPSHTIVPMPALSPTMESGSIAKWILKEGDKFEPGNAICEVETDKATVTFDAQDEGYLAKILVGSGDIKVGQPIMVTVDDAASVAAFSSFKLEGGAAAPPAAPVAAPKPSAVPVPVKAVAVPSPPSSSYDDNSRVFASPFARKLARDSGVDITLLRGKGSGPKGRVVAADIANASALIGASKAPVSAAKVVAGKAVGSTKGSSSVGLVYEDFELTDLSRALADRFTKSKVHVPHYYLSVELNLSKLLELRHQLNNDNKDDIASISVLDLLLKATGLAIKQVPDVNGSWNDTFIRRYNQVDINVVMGAGSSVVTPVIRHVNSKGLRQITTEIAGFEDNLFREDKSSGAFSAIDPSSLAPGTFSIHNLGMYGIKSAAPIILPPQACALAFGAVIDSVVPRTSGGAGDNWEVAPVMVATLSCDHRVIDGAVGAQWLSAFKTIVENPASLLL